MGYIGQKLWDIFGIYMANTIGYIGLRLLVILWDIFGNNYGIYWAKIMGYIGLQLWDIFGKTMGYTGPLDILSKK